MATHSSVFSRNPYARLGEHYSEDGNRIGLDRQNGLTCMSGHEKDESLNNASTFPLMTGDGQKTEDESLLEALAAVAAAEAAEAAKVASLVSSNEHKKKIPVETIPLSPVARLIDALAVLTTWASRSIAEAVPVAKSLSTSTSNSKTIIIFYLSFS